MNEDENTSICKGVSKAFNMSSTYFEFLVNLDLMNISLDDAKNAWQARIERLIAHIKPFCCDEYGIFSFKHIFESNASSNVFHVNFLPYVTSIVQDMHKGKIIMMRAIDNNGRVKEHCINIGFLENTTMIEIFVHDAIMSALASQ